MEAPPDAPVAAEKEKEEIVAPKENVDQAPAEKKDEEAPSAAKPAQQSTGGGGGGWGWFSSVASYVPSLSTVVSTSASIVKDLGAVIEPDSGDDEPSKPAAAENAPQQDEAEASATSPGPPPQPHVGELTPAQKILEPLTAGGAAPEPPASSDGWDDGDDVLDGLIGAGTQLVSQGTTIVKEAWQTSGVKDSELVKGAAEAGRSAGSTAVDFLDAVGRHSLRFLTSQVGDPSKPRLVPIVPLPSTAVPVATEAPPAAMPTFEAIFEEASGPRSLQALERLSTESLRKIQQVQRKLTTPKLLTFNGQVEAIQSTLFSDEEKQQLPPHLDTQLATTRERVADLTKEAKTLPDPVSSLRKESILVLAKQAAAGVIAVQMLVETIVKQAEGTPQTTEALVARAGEIQALGAAHSALATRTAEIFSEAVRSLTSSDNPPSPVPNHIYVDGASAAASIADAVRFVLPIFQSLLIAITAE